MIERKHRSYLSVAIAATLGGTAVILTWQMMCPPPAVDASRQAWKACIAFGLLKDFQTLIAGVLAILAALIAVQPVWLQLRKMQQQTDIASRDVIDRRLAGIEALVQSDLKAVRDGIKSVSRMMDHDQLEFVFPLNVHQVDVAETELWACVRALYASQEKRLGTTSIEEARLHLIIIMRTISECVSAINAPTRLVITGDYLSDEDTANLTSHAENAEKQLIERWSSVSAALLHFQEMSAVGCGRLREHIRKIDDMIIDSND